MVFSFNRGAVTAVMPIQHANSGDVSHLKRKCHNDVFEQQPCSTNRRTSWATVCEKPMSIDIAQAYEKYGPMVLRRCQQLLGASDQAQDLMQDVFVQLLRRGDGLTSEHMSSLLYTVATRLCLNRIRQHKSRGAHHADATIERIVALCDEGARASARHDLMRLLGREPASTATMAVMHWVDGMTHEEVAQTMAMSVSGVRRRLRVLQDKLGADAEEIMHATDR